MALSDIVRRGVALADRQTASLQVAVQHRAWDGTRTRAGAPNLGDAVTRKAIVEWKQRRVRNTQGDEIMSPCRITFLTPVTITPHDKLQAPPITEFHSIANQQSITDPKTGRGYYVQVDLQ